ncbi:MAG: hypothetical protein LBD68_06340 [Zoogloeaceae bacterium]|jgi:type IV pilus assembly protein PilX|nr:hypothetical protein [Zoogloeaceae bacterium]
MHTQANLKWRERGSVLLLGMVAVVVMLLLGAAAIRSTLLQERMAGGFAEQYQAFQAAEIALRAGETRVNAGAAHGLSCFYTPGNAPDPDDVAVWKGASSCAIDGNYYRADDYGAAAPRFFIEQQEDAPDVSIEAGAMKRKEIYKVTAQGTGGVKSADGDPVIRVVLQSSITH